MKDVMKAVYLLIVTMVAISNAQYKIVTSTGFGYSTGINGTQSMGLLKKFGRCYSETGQDSVKIKSGAFNTTFETTNSTSDCAADSWVGLFDTDYLEIVQDDPKSMAFAKTMQKWSTSKGISLLGVPILLFTGIGMANNDILGADGKVDNSKSVSAVSLSVIISAGVSFIWYIVSDNMETHYLNKSRDQWNSNKFP